MGTIGRKWERKNKPPVVLGHCSVCDRSITNQNRGMHKINCEGKEEVRRRMREENPMADLDVRARATVGILKAIQDGRVVPFGRGSGGNGRGPTATEEQASEILIPLGFVFNHVIGTSPWTPGQGLPKNYKVDFAHVSSKIVVEIDGSSHKNRQEADARKAEFLSSRGWKLIRVPVQQARRRARLGMNELSELLAKVSTILTPSSQ